MQRGQRFASPSARDRRETGEEEEEKEEEGAREPGAHDADSRGGKAARPSVRFWRRRRRKKEEGRREERGKIVVSRFDGASSLLLFGEEEKLEERWGCVDREACVGTRGTGSKMEEGRRKRMKARLGTRGEEERRSREEGKFM